MLSRFFACCLVLITTVNQHGYSQTAAIKQAQQLLVVVTCNWDTVPGTLYAFEKVNGTWVKQFSNPVVVGAKGLGIGDGIIPVNVTGAPVKKEGDMKSPAGIFAIGDAFGYGSKADAGFIKARYIQAKDTVICVDDAHSIYYNRIISADTARQHDWNSFEHMHLTKDYYKWGLFVQHNSPTAVPGHGSCIFMHIWGSSHEGTEGCTAMKEADILTLLHWINTAKKPLLVQLPVAEYTATATELKLPRITE